MKTLVFEGPRTVVLRERAKPAPKPGEVMIAVRRVGICGSDTHGYLGTTGRRIPPMVMGHEFAGAVCELGEGAKRFHKGELVTAHPMLHCGTCRYCRKGLTNLCEKRALLGVMDVDGAMQEFVSLPEEYLLPLPNGVSCDEGAMIEPLAVAYRAVRQLGLLEGRSVLLSGAGPIGLLVLMVLRYYGAGFIAVTDLSEKRLALAKELGASSVINPASEAIHTVLSEAGFPSGVDVSVEAVGATPTVQQSLRYLRSAGTAVWVGNSAPEVKVPMQEIVTRELRVLGTYIYTAQDFAEALQLQGKAHFPLLRLVSRIVSPKEAPSAFEALAAGDDDLLKVLIAFDD